MFFLTVCCYIHVMGNFYCRLLCTSTTKVNAFYVFRRWGEKGKNPHLRFLTITWTCPGSGWRDVFFMAFLCSSTLTGLFCGWRVLVINWGHKGELIHFCRTSINRNGQSWISVDGVRMWGHLYWEVNQKHHIHVSKKRWVAYSHVQCKNKTYFSVSYNFTRPNVDGAHAHAANYTKKASLLKKLHKWMKLASDPFV